jgi:hypothetical protein
LAAAPSCAINNVPGEGEGEGEGENEGATNAACLRSAECNGENDPQTFCTEARLDCFEDDRCAAIQAACEGESNALAVCLLEHGTCEDGIFAADATADGGPCEEPLDDITSCVSDVSP